MSQYPPGAGDPYGQPPKDPYGQPSPGGPPPSTYGQSPYGSPAGQPGYAPRPAKPGSVQAVAILTLVGGIVSTFYAAILILSIALSTLCIGLIYLPMYWGLVSGILAIVKGAKLLGQNDRMENPPLVPGILLIINIINLDILSCVLGVVVVVFSNNPEVKAYYQGR